MGGSSNPLAVVVLAAGRGTRMRSEHAKVLHPVAGKPLVLWVLDTALALRPDRIAVVVGYEAAEVERVCAAHLEARAATVPVAYPLQRAQRGTGDAVRAALSSLAGLDGDVLILYGDVPALTPATLERLVRRHREGGATLSLLTTTVADPAGYGRIRRQPDGALVGIVEQRDLTPDDAAIREINPGIYCVAARFLEPALAALRADNAQREYYLTDVVGIAVAEGAPVVTIAAEADEVAGINSRAEMAAVEGRARRAIVARWMDAGVTIRDPATTYVEAGVTIGADTEIGPNTQLLGRTIIGRGCRIDGTALLRDATLGDEVYVRLGVVMTECEIGDQAVLGPFAHVRPGSVLETAVHIGNFVETKKTRIGKGSKANHLAYLGDAEIGAGANIGAGTITCNYDGFDKHRTVIGDRVQIGSDTQLVAPVRVGADAYVGAGTTVTEDVPPGHLALSRTKQQVVPGWTARFRARKTGAPAPASGGPVPRRRAKSPPPPPKRKPKRRTRLQGSRRGKR